MAPPAPLPSGEQGRGRGSAVPGWVWALLALVVIGLLTWWLLSSRSAPTDAPASATPAASSAAPASPTEAPTTEAPTTSAAPSPTQDPAAAVSDAVTAFADEVKALEKDGGVGKDAAKDLDAAVREVEKALRSEDAQQVPDATRGLRQVYDERVRDGGVDGDAAGRLDPLLSDLEEAADAYGG